MQIQPTQEVLVNLTCDEHKMLCHLIQLNDNEMQLSSDEFLEKNAEVSFKSQYFFGNAVVISVDYIDIHFNFRLKIRSIKFQPGLLVNMKL